MIEAEFDRLSMLVAIHKVNFATGKEGTEVTITLKASATPEVLELARRVGERARVNVLRLQRSLPLEMGKEEG